MNFNSAATNNSAGTQANRFLDSLGLPDNLGDAIGLLVDRQTGNSAGALRNLIDLNSGLTTRQMDSIFGRGAGRARFGRAFAPRRSPSGSHLCHSTSYAVRDRVGDRVRPGQRYAFNVGHHRVTGRITGAQYRGSFARPVRLRNGDFLFRGRSYDSIRDVRRDVRDGRIDGNATINRRGQRCHRPGAGLGPTLGAIGSSINDILGSLFGAIGANSPGGSTGAGSTGGTGSTGGSGNTGSVLNDPNMSLEDKLALLMSKLSEHLDKQIEEKMGAIESQISKENKSGKSSANGGGVGGASSTGSTGGTGGTGGTGQSSNLQLLQTQLQQLLQKRQQMFQTMSNVIKSLHDTSMNTIRQLKA